MQIRRIIAATAASALTLALTACGAPAKTTPSAPVAPGKTGAPAASAPAAPKGQGTGFGPITTVDKEPDFLKVPSIKMDRVKEKQEAEEEAGRKLVKASNGKYTKYGALFTMDSALTQMESQHYSAAFDKEPVISGGKATVHFACLATSAEAKVEVRVKLSPTEKKYVGGEIVCAKGVLTEGSFDIELAPSKAARATIVSPPVVGHWIMGIEMKK